MTNNVNLKDMIVKFLEELNNGKSIKHNEIEIDYKPIKHLIERLVQIKNSPYEENYSGYSFIKGKRKTFEKYHIEDIANILIDRENSKNNKNPDDIIKDFVKNEKDYNKSISCIFYDDIDLTNSKKDEEIKAMVNEYIMGKSSYNKKDYNQILIKHATSENHCKKISDIIINYKLDLECQKKLENIVKESLLPRRSDDNYTIIPSYEEYELTHCISYEMAIRNDEVSNILEILRSLTLFHRELFKVIYYNDYSEVKLNPILQDKLEEILIRFNITLDIDLNSSTDKETFDNISKILSEYTTSLRDDYFLVHDRNEIIPEGMEEDEITKELHHYENDPELSKHMSTVIDNSLKSDKYYKDNYDIQDGYAIYQGGYENSNSFDLNKIFPNFKRPMREFNQTQVAFNMSLPKDEIIAYISKIKDDYDKKNNSYKTLNQLLYGNDTRSEDKLEHKQKEKYADDFFIYDYYTQSDEEHEKKLESIQKKLSQFHGMKVEKGRNDYQFIDYDEALIEEVPIDNLKRTTSISFNELSECFKSKKNIIHYLATKTIEERYNKIKEYIDGKKYKTLIHHE